MAVRVDKTSQGKWLIIVLDCSQKTELGFKFISRTEQSATVSYHIQDWSDIDFIFAKTVATVSYRIEEVTVWLLLWTKQSVNMAVIIGAIFSAPRRISLKQFSLISRSMVLCVPTYCLACMTDKERHS